MIIKIDNYPWIPKVIRAITNVGSKESKPNIKRNISSKQ